VQVKGETRVLVVDDNHDVTDSLVLVFETLGVEARGVYDGAAALDAAASFQPDVVFLDLGMPGMDGFETARRLRQLFDGRDVLIVALTGWGEAEHRRHSREAGFDEHLAKPVDVDVLRRILERRL
jgi:CheY-like chemotaxis protein